MKVSRTLLKQIQHLPVQVLTIPNRDLTCLTRPALNFGKDRSIATNKRKVTKKTKAWKVSGEASSQWEVQPRNQRKATSAQVSL